MITLVRLLRYARRRKAAGIGFVFGLLADGEHQPRAIAVATDSLSTSRTQTSPGCAKFPTPLDALGLDAS